ncbi:uncharacterized protein LOC121736528 [Aricia agestis]|uniref:uncharacterized protein LOC121736528 n=1 Tax=Aricia agestis TaxID=91739 RepID=UPI001C20BD7D|nr:uncharacterized protein LOC121736528 [Aricia agestis]
MVLLYFVLLLKSVSCFVNLTDIRPPVDANHTIMADGNFTVEGVENLCENRESICRDAGIRVCAKRIKNSTTEYKEFSNACFLFMGNLCEYSDYEFAIVRSGRCRPTETRRIYTVDFAQTTTLRKFYKTIVPIFNDTPTTIYEILTAIDGHPCPLSCPSTYEPWCIFANPNDKYVKIYKFANHCAMDLYYCKNWNEFEPPDELLDKDPDAYTSTDQSALKTTGCASQRFYYYFHFAEIASSLQRHGFLEGNQRYNKILRPYERNPAFGR